jgi:hypothetical protein
MPKINIQTPTARARLGPQGRPYKIRLLPGVWLGYRAAQSGTGSWIVIAANGRSGYWTKAFAHADDKQKPDGAAVLTYEQAANRARALARGDANAGPIVRRPSPKLWTRTRPISPAVGAAHTTRRTRVFICPTICWRSPSRQLPVSSFVIGATH